MACPPEEPPKLILEEVKLSVETTLEAKMTIDDFLERRKRATKTKTITSEIVTLHSVEGNTYRVKFVVKIRNYVS